MSATPRQTDLLTAIDVERDALLALLPRFSDEQWREAARGDGWNPHDIVMHLADSHYGMALMVLGEIKPSLPLNSDGWMDADEHNAQRRAKNAALPREKAMSRLEAAFGHARRAIEATDDLNAPGPYGPIHTCGFWLQRLIDHTRAHRGELEEMLAS